MTITNLNIPTRVKTVQLVDQLKHGPLHFVVAPSAVVEPRAADGVDFVEEDQTSLFGSCHFEKFPNHPGALANVLLYKLRSNDANETRVRAVGHGAGAEGLPGTRRTKEQNTCRG